MTCVHLNMGLRGTGMEKTSIASAHKNGLSSDRALKPKFINCLKF